MKIKIIPLIIFLKFFSLYNPVIIAHPVIIANSAARVINSLKSLRTAQAVLSGGIGMAGGAALTVIIDTIIEALQDEGFYFIGP